MGFDKGVAMILQMFFWACVLILAIQVAGRILLMLLGYTSDEIEEEPQRHRVTPDKEAQELEEWEELEEWWKRREEVRRLHHSLNPDD